MNIEHPAQVSIDALRTNVSASFEEARAMPLKSILQVNLIKQSLSRSLRKIGFVLAEQTF